MAEYIEPPFDADVIEIRAAENGYVVTAFKRGHQYLDDNKTYRSWVATRETLTTTIEQVLDGQPLVVHTAILPARKLRSGAGKPGDL
jgi:hypothetical protein